MYFEIGICDPFLSIKYFILLHLLATDNYWQ